MSGGVPSRGNHGDHHARPEGALSGRRGARVEDMTRSRLERPVDTIALARKLAEENA